MLFLCCDLDKNGRNSAVGFYDAVKQKLKKEPLFLQAALGASVEYLTANSFKCSVVFVSKSNMDRLNEQEFERHQYAQLMETANSHISTWNASILRAFRPVLPPTLRFSS